MPEICSRDLTIICSVQPYTDNTWIRFGELAEDGSSMYIIQLLIKLHEGIIQAASR